MDCDYIGLSPKVNPPGSIIRERKNNSGNSDSLGLTDTLDYTKLEPFKLKDGRKVYLLRGTIKKDFIISSDSDCIWLNNQQFFKKE